MAKYKGNVVSVQTGIEMSFGSGDAATEKLNLTSVDFDASFEKKEDESLMAAVALTGKELVSMAAAGNISGNLRPGNATTVIELALGVKATDTTTLPGVSIQTITPVGVNDSLPSFVLEIAKGAADKQYVGCKVNSLKLSAKPKDYVQYTLDIKAKQENALLAMTPALTSPTGKFYLGSSSVFKIGATNLEGMIDSFEMDYNNNLDDGTYTFGSGLTPNEMTQGRREIKISFEGYYQTETENLRETLLKDGDITSLEMTFLSPDKIGVTNEFKRINLLFPNVTVDEAKVSISGANDYIKISFTATALAIGAVSPVTIKVYE